MEVEAVNGRVVRRAPSRCPKRWETMCLCTKTVRSLVAAPGTQGFQIRGCAWGGWILKPAKLAIGREPPQSQFIVTSDIQRLDTL